MSFVVHSHPVAIAPVVMPILGCEAFLREIQRLLLYYWVETEFQATGKK